MRPFRPSCGSGDRSARETSIAHAAQPGRAVRGRDGRSGGCLLRILHAQTPFVPHFGKNQIRVRHVPVAHLHDRPLSRSTTTPRPSSISSGWPATPKARTSRSARICSTTSPSRFRSSSSRRAASSSSRTSCPAPAQEGVGAFAEPIRDRMVLPIDEPPDLLYRLIVHELTHIFEFDIIPQVADSPQRAAVGERRAVRLHDRRHGGRST